MAVKKKAKTPDTSPFVGMTGEEQQVKVKRYRCMGPCYTLHAEHLLTEVDETEYGRIGGKGFRCAACLQAGKGRRDD